MPEIFERKHLRDLVQIVGRTMEEEVWGDDRLSDPERSRIDP